MLYKNLSKPKLHDVQLLNNQSKVLLKTVMKSSYIILYTQTEYRLSLWKFQFFFHIIWIIPYRPYGMGHTIWYGVL